MDLRPAMTVNYPAWSRVSARHVLHAIVFAALLVKAIEGETGHGRQLDAAPAPAEDEPQEIEKDPAKHFKWLRLFLNIGVLLLIILANCCVCICYWAVWIRPKPNQYVPLRPVIPNALKGRFVHRLTDCGADCGTFCCFMFCPVCTLADYWYRMGWIHAVMKDTWGSMDSSCPGWRYFAGVAGHVGASQIAGCCIPCVFAALRGGLGWLDSNSQNNSSMDPIVPARIMWETPHKGCNTFCKDCCLWCWCGPCVGTQEYRQVMDLLRMGPVQQLPLNVVTTGQIIGQPVAVGVVVMGEKVA